MNFERANRYDKTMVQRLYDGAKRIEMNGKAVHKA